MKIIIEAEPQQEERLPFSEDRRTLTGLSILDRVSAVTLQTSMVAYNDKDAIRQKKFWKVTGI